MKKFLLLAGVFYVVFLLSFKENSGDPESFAKILKDHPDRLAELLKVASSYQDTLIVSEKYLSPKDILTPDQLDIFRSKTKSRTWNRTHPEIVISTLALNELIKNHLNTGDSVVFYLGKYSKKDPERIKRYNERNGGALAHSDNPPFTYKNLRGRTAFAMQVFSDINSEKSKSHHSSTLKSGYFTPSFGKGNHDTEEFLMENFNSARKAVSEAYEISRLCPPPREGCNGTN